MSPLKLENLSRSLERQAQTRPDHPAVVEDGRAITYGELSRRVAESADHLERVGVTRG